MKLTWETSDIVAGQRYAYPSGSGHNGREFLICRQSGTGVDMFVTVDLEDGVATRPEPARAIAERLTAFDARPLDTPT